MAIQVRNPELVDLLRADFETRWACVVDTWDPPNMADGTDTSTTIAVPGARVGDPALASHDQIGANDVMISAHVQAAAVVRVVLLNRTGGGLNIASGNLFVAVRVRY